MPSLPGPECIVKIRDPRCGQLWPISAQVFERFRQGHFGDHKMAGWGWGLPSFATLSNCTAALSLLQATGEDKVPKLQHLSALFMLWNVAFPTILRTASSKCPPITSGETLLTDEMLAADPVITIASQFPH